MHSLKTLFSIFKSNTIRTKKILKRRTLKERQLPLLHPRERKTTLNLASKKIIRVRLNLTSANLSRLKSGKVRKLLYQFCFYPLNLEFTRQILFSLTKTLARFSIPLLESQSCPKSLILLLVIATRRSPLPLKRC